MNASTLFFHDRLLLNTGGNNTSLELEAGNNYSHIYVHGKLSTMITE
jgi:hypothetical protein